MPLIPFEKTSETSLFKLAIDYRHKGQVLEMNYQLKGPTDRLSWPQSSEPAAHLEGLWNSLCFECFYKPEGGGSYIEWNFSPTGDWWDMGFSGYRIRDSAYASSPLKKNIRAQISPREFRLEVAIPLLKLPAQVGWMAILKYRDGTMTHWALKHSGPKPDFHHNKSLSHYLDSPEDE